MLIFSGYRIEEIQRMPKGPQILKHVDVLVAGRYVATQHLGETLLGSSNQRIHFLSDRYSHSNLTSTPPSEVILHADGSLTLSGIKPILVEWEDAFKREPVS